MKASLAAGVHPNCLQVLGHVSNAPQPALILPLIPPEYTALGLPPSFSSITRDTFISTAVFSYLTILTIIRGITSVVAHLHARGIMHGDIYAHNILYNSEGSPLLVDFGAASFFQTSTPLAQKFELIEVRAIGCLLDDLLMRAAEVEDMESPQQRMAALLSDLRDKCMARDHESRPSFKDILKCLDNC